MQSVNNPLPNWCETFVESLITNVEINVEKIPLEKSKSGILKYLETDLETDLETEGFVLEQNEYRYHCQQKLLEEMIGSNVILDTQNKKINPSGFWYVDSEADIYQILEDKLNKIRVRDIKRLQIFIQDDIPYTINSINTCKPYSTHPKLNFGAYNSELDKKIYLVYPENYLLNLDLESNIIVI
jgi:hypothetical protein